VGPGCRGDQLAGGRRRQLDRFLLGPRAWQAAVGGRSDVVMIGSGLAIAILERLFWVPTDASRVKASAYLITVTS
jgi:hypothetical protein